MFYTKYRPQKFSEISKPNEVAEALATQIKQKKTVHAYLFTGPRGTGKTTTARILAKVLNCAHVDKNGDPCDKCDVCLGVKNGSFLDLIEIDAASNRGIDDIRSLRDKIRLAPSLGKIKVYIIDEVHMLTIEAFNALLKTLEEPPVHAVFVLCTTEEQKVPDTIKSRCQVFKFKRATVSQIVEKLQKICEKEKVDMQKDLLKKIAEAAYGGFRDAETLLQQVVEGNMDPESFMGAYSKQSYIEFVDLLLDGDQNLAIKRVNDLFENGADLYVWTGGLLRYLRDLLFVLSGVDEYIMDFSDKVRESVEKQTEKFLTAETNESLGIVNVIEAFVKAQNAIKSSFIPQLPLELAIVETCKDSKLVDESKSVAARPAVEKSSKRLSTDVDMSIVDEKWQNVLEKVVSFNHSIQGLLKASKPAKIEGNILFLEVFYSFHKERLESLKNKKIVEEVMTEVFGFPLILKCELSQDKPKVKGRETGELTDYNVAAVFDGNLPI